MSIRFVFSVTIKSRKPYTRRFLYSEVRTYLHLLINVQFIINVRKFYELCSFARQIALPNLVAFCTKGVIAFLSLSVDA